jgi:pseudouridine synthase
VEKEYYFEVRFPLSDKDITELEDGVDIGGYVTAKCKVNRIGQRSANIILTEGKYHQIKLMLGAVHNQVMKLKRIRFDSIVLDENELTEGQWRYLSEGEEQNLLHRANKI